MLQVSSLDLLEAHHPGGLFGDGSPDELPTSTRTLVVGTHLCFGACHDGVSFGMVHVRKDLCGMCIHPRYAPIQPPPNQMPRAQ